MPCQTCHRNRTRLGREFYAPVRTHWPFLAGVCVALLLASGADARARAQTITPPNVQGNISLEQAIGIALRHSPLVLEKLAMDRLAHEGARAARAHLLPSLSAVGLGTASSMGATLSAPSSADPPFLRTVPDKPALSLGLMAMAPLFTGGRLERTYQAALTAKQASANAIRAAQQDVTYQIQTAYFAALSAQARARAAASRLDAVGAMLQNTAAEFEAGRTIEAAVQRVRAERGDAEREAAQTQGEQRLALLNLLAAMGADLRSRITLDTSAFDAIQEIAAPSDPAPVVARLPEVVAARAEVDAARLRLQASRGRSRPQLNALLMAEAFAPSEMRKSTAVTVGVALSVPLFDGGERAAEVGAAAAELAQAEAKLRQIELTAIQELMSASVALETAEAVVRSARDAVKAARASYEVVTLRVQAQRAILVEQLDALNALVRAQASEIEALTARATAAARLRRAMGGS